MENTVWYLESCDTCRRILQETLPGTAGFVRREIKSKPPTQEEIDYLAKRAGSYAALLNTRARKLQSPDYKGIEITDSVAEKLLLEDYTFLKRPVFLISDKVFAGNSPSVVESVKTALGI